MKKIVRIAALIFLVVVLMACLLAWRIYSFGNASSSARADAAVVLGAAVWTTDVSPVFRERINQAINLYRKGQVRKLIFTGGQGNPGEPTESAAARDYALESGIPLNDILIEEKSHTTYENILYAKELADRNGIKSVLI